jgi:hypothetical protein
MSELPHNPTQLRRVILTSFNGTAIEWYDYFIYRNGGRAYSTRDFFYAWSQRSAVNLAGRFFDTPELWQLDLHATKIRL